MPEGQLDSFLTTMCRDNPSVNLAHLDVDGPGDFNMYNVHAREIPRIDMPQVPESMEDLAPFLSELNRTGVNTELLGMDPRLLRMTQNQLDSGKVAQLYGFIEGGGWRQNSIIMVSREGMILDGHHRWAAACASRMHGSDFTVQVLKVDMPIDNLLALAQKFSRAHVGAPQ
jgi:hypothetical protein